MFINWKFFFVITFLFIVWSCSFLFQNDCFFTRLSEIYSFIMILSVFYFTLFLFLYCHIVFPKRKHTGKSWASWCNYRRRWSRNFMNFEKNMRNILGHTIFAAAVTRQIFCLLAVAITDVSIINKSLTAENLHINRCQGQIEAISK